MSQKYKSGVFTVLRGGGQGFCDDKGLSNKKHDDGGKGGQKLFKTASRHLWTTPNDKNSVLPVPCCLQSILMTSGLLQNVRILHTYRRPSLFADF